MKAELKLYCCLGFLILLILLFRINIPDGNSGSNTSLADEISTFDELLVEMNCEVFFVKGEKNRIVYEGPEKIIDNIETIHNEGSILIKKKSNKILSGMIDFLKNRKNSLTIYISVTCLDNLEVIPLEGPSKIKYSSEELIGLSLKNGESVLIESKISKLTCI